LIGRKRTHPIRDPTVDRPWLNEETMFAILSGPGTGLARF
jgi:hypothetical protein